MEGLVVLLLLGLGAWYLFGRKEVPGKSRSRSSGFDEGTYVTRMGQQVKAGEAFFASNSVDIPRMVAALEADSNLIDRHFLLQNLVAETYKRRSEPEMAELCAKVAEMHLAELPRIIPALKKDMGGEVPRISTFQHFATLLTERGEYERAISVCEDALRRQLHDGTKGGYQGRIERIKKKAAQSSK